MQRVINRFKRIRAVYVISFTCLIIALLLTWYNNSQLSNGAKDVRHALLVVTKLEEMLSAVKDAETGYRGYLLTKNLKYLEPYNASKTKTDSVYTDLINLIPEQTHQFSKLQSIRQAVLKKENAIEKGLAIFQSDTVKGIHLVADSLLSKELMDSVRIQMTAMVNAEFEILKIRDQKVTEFQLRTKYIIWGTILFATVLMFIGIHGHSKDITARLKAFNRAEGYKKQLLLQIEELAKANAQLKEFQESEKLATIGRLAQVMAHEVRNPLTNIGLASSELRETIIEKTDDTELYFDMIERNTVRINELLSELLNSTKLADISLEYEQIDELIQEVLALAQDRISLYNVELKLDIDQKKLSVWIDFDKLKIACLNIVINAIEAMKEIEYPKLLISAKETTNHIILSIADNGTGMTAETKAKLFEPFFTQKADGNGLGLTNTQTIVFNHLGNIEVESELNKGTVFHIKLRKEKPNLG